MITVNIFNDTDKKYLPYKHVRALVPKVLKSYGIKNMSVNVVYVDDATILELNKQYLKHNYFTDVITFDFGSNSEIPAEIYISVETARKQANDYGVSLNEEIKRLAVHGALHLVGFKDGTASEKDEMKLLENKFLGIE